LDNIFLIPRFDVDESEFVVDPKNSSVSDFNQVNADKICIPPHSFVLGQTIETFNMPKDILGVCFNKSTYARCGIVVNVTPLRTRLAWAAYD
jgi:dCTP deaminase